MFDDALIFIYKKFIK